MNDITDGGVEDKIAYSDARKYVQHYINMEMRDPCGLDKNAKAFLALVTRIAKLEDALNLGLEYWAHRQQRYKNRSPVWVEKAREALNE